MPRAKSNCNGIISAAELSAAAGAGTAATPSAPPEPGCGDELAEVGRELGSPGAPAVLGGHGARVVAGSLVLQVPTVRGASTKGVLVFSVLPFFFFNYKLTNAAPRQCPGLAVPSSRPPPAGGSVGGVAAPCRVQGAGAVRSSPRGCQELGKLFSSQLDDPDYYLVSRSGLLIKLGTAGFAVPAACLGRGIYLLLTREGN